MEKGKYPASALAGVVLAVLLAAAIATYGARLQGRSWGMSLLVGAVFAIAFGVPGAWLTLRGIRRGGGGSGR